MFAVETQTNISSLSFKTIFFELFNGYIFYQQNHSTISPEKWKSISSNVSAGVCESGYIQRVT